MEQKVVYIEKNPKENANIISKICFWWSKELFRKGFHRELTLADLYRPLKQDESENLGDRLEQCWKQELMNLKQGKNVQNNKEPNVPHLEKALLRAFGFEYLCIGLLTLIYYGFLAILQPILQSWILNYFDDNKELKMITKTDSLIYASCLILSLLLSVVVRHHTDLLSEAIGMKIRIACCSLIYRKALRLSKVALSQTSSGQVVNLLTNDVSRFDELFYFLNFLWITPLQVIIVAVIIWQQIGILTLAAIAALTIISLPIHSITLSFSGKLRRIIAKKTDKRIQLMNELIAGIQVVKMYAWEEPFAKIVAAIRATEIKKIKFASYIRAMCYASAVFTHRIVLFVTLISFSLLGNRLTADLSYTLTNYFSIIQLTVGVLFPNALIFARESMVSIRRLEKFLLLDEQSDKGSLNTQQFKAEKAEKKLEIIGMTNMNQNLTKKPEHTPVSIVLEHVSANWIPKQLPPTLCNISMEIESGQLCALVGPVGSGKSSFLNLLLKELPLGAGRLKFHYKPLDDLNNEHDASNLRISYASQETWLFAGTLRDNILFGQPYNKERYIAVTKACALTRDFQQFPHGDMSNVGEGGCSLSGGQRARVNLARAVYKAADLYLLDDPLSAVDARVAKHLFRECIKKFLSGKTRILVTHQLQFVKQADNIVVLDRGCVHMQGKYEQLCKLNEGFNEMMSRITTEAKKKTENQDTSKETSFERRNRASVTSNNSSVISYDYEEHKFAAEEEDETTAVGRISNKVYTEYFRQGGSFFMLFVMIFTIIISQVCTSGHDYWISYWINLEAAKKLVSNGSITNRYNYLFNDTFLSGIFTLDHNGLLPNVDAIYVYTFCIILLTITVLGRNMFFMKICTTASKNLHNLMFSNILRTTMSFFHHNASGRILNRFSKDVGTMDEILPKMMLDTLEIFVLVSGVFVVVLIVNIWMIIPLVILFILLYYIRLLYMKIAQNVKRIESVGKLRDMHLHVTHLYYIKISAKSPVLSHIITTLNGLTTIRTSGPEIISLLRKQFDDLQDMHTSAWYISLVVSTAFGALFDLAACVFIACICYSFILLDTGDTLGGNVGLALSQSLFLMGALQHGVKQSGNMILQITSVERILQYTNLPKEASWTSKDPPDDWPKYGEVTLKNVSMKYEEDKPPVLKNLNVTIEPGWKVGIVGRTGAGKTSLISVLFRLFDEGLEGQIIIDEKDIKTLGLHELRSKISIIPQQPFLFSESLRYNLDPFNSYDDVRLWESLRQVELNDCFLDQEVMQGGSNLSTGQKQLICLARAILKNNRILVLDEATANIDSHTDALIQKTIRTKFVNCTVITIAHRLHTIIDCDRIVVMDDGRIAEFGHAYELLRDKPEGVFSQMVNNTNAAMAQTLRTEAEKSYFKYAEHSSNMCSRL
nr:PREDICTED: probable multidrug resistance-associated protein lethal(2)03659 isoform X1 [Megachile rotundata]